MQSESQPSSDATVTATLLKFSPRSEAHQRDQVLRTAEIYSLGSSEMGIDSILSAMARSLKMKNVAVVMFGARENFLTHQLGFEGKSSIEIMRLLSAYFSPVSSSITNFTADIIVNDVKIGALVAFPSEKTPVDRVQPIITEVASSISTLLNDRYREAISPDTDLHLAQLTFLFLSMIRSPLRKVLSVRSQLASSFDFLHQVIESFPNSTLFHSSMPSNEDMLSYFDLFNQEIDVFRQETRAFHFVVDAALRSLHHHVVSYEEEEVFGACHHHSSNSDLEKVLSDSLETITKQSTILTRHSSTHQSLEEEDDDDIAIIDDNNDEESDAMSNEEDIKLVPVEDSQDDATGKRAIYYPKTPGCTPRTWPYSGEQSHNHSSHNIKLQYNLSRKCIFPVEPNNVESVSSEVAGLPPLSPGKRKLSFLHSFPSLPLPPPPTLGDTNGEEEGEEGEHTSSKSIRTPMASCSFSYSFTSSPMSRTETLPESYSQPTPLARMETTSLTHSSNLSNNDMFHGVLNTHSASDINLDPSAVVVACEPSATCTSPLSLTLTHPAATATATTSDVVAFHPHHHYHYQHVDEVNHNRSDRNVNVTKTIVDKNNHSYHNMRTSFVDNSAIAKKYSDEEDDDDEDEESEESVTVAVSYDWDHATHDRPRDMADIAEAIRNTFASLAVLDT